MKKSSYVLCGLVILLGCCLASPDSFAFAEPIVRTGPDTFIETAGVAVAEPIVRTAPGTITMPFATTGALPETV